MGSVRRRPQDTSCQHYQERALRISTGLCSLKEHVVLLSLASTVVLKANIHFPLLLCGKDWTYSSSRARPGLSYDLTLLCRVQAPYLGPQAWGGNVWTFDAVLILSRLVAFHPGWGPHNSAPPFPHVYRGWRSMCCTNSLQTVPGRHTQLSVSPVRERQAKVNNVSKNIMQANKYRFYSINSTRRVNPFMLEKKHNAQDLSQASKLLCTTIICTTP